MVSWGGMGWGRAVARGALFFRGGEYHTLLPLVPTPHMRGSKKGEGSELGGCQKSS
jgi:hypothetical protein